MEWFRFYHGALDDPKVQRLPPALFKHWVNLLCLASQEGQRGNLPDIEAIAFRLRLAAPKATEIIRELTTAGLIDRDLCGGLSIHNWTGRQRASDNVTERVRKHRSGPTSNETLHETLRETESKRYGNGLDTEQIQIQNSSPPTPQSANAAAADFQPTYPTTLGAKWPLALQGFTGLWPGFTAGMVEQILCDAERDVGPLSASQLKAGIEAAKIAVERALNGPRPPNALKPFATKIVIERLREVARGPNP